MLSMTSQCFDAHGCVRFIVTEPSFKTSLIRTHVLSVSFDRYFSPRIELVRSFTLLFFWLGRGDRQKTKLPLKRTCFFNLKLQITHYPITNAKTASLKV